MADDLATVRSWARAHAVIHHTLWGGVWTESRVRCMTIHDRRILTATPDDLADLNGDVAGCFLRVGDGYHPVPVAEAVARVRDRSMREGPLGTWWA